MADHTSLLPPTLGVQIAWGLTGAFPENDAAAAKMAAEEESRLKELQKMAEGDGQESRYLAGAVAAIYASARSLQTVYKGRDLHFKENAKLREEGLEAVKDASTYGVKLEDVLKSWFGTGVGGVAGAAAGIFGELGLGKTLGLLIGSGAVGLVINAGFAARGRKKRQALYVRQDYERTVYYIEYLRQVQNILERLYGSLQDEHIAVFAKSCPESDGGAEAVRKMIGAVEPKMCEYVHQHMREGQIQPEHWAVCEAGDDNARGACVKWQPMPAKGSG